MQESEKQLNLRLKQTNDKLVTENAELSACLTELKQKLESEIRVRENRDAKLLLDTQEVVVSREREKELRTQISRLQNELERERTKAKTLQDKVNNMSFQMLMLLKLLLFFCKLLQKIAKMVKLDTYLLRAIGSEVQSHRLENKISASHDRLTNH